MSRHPRKSPAQQAGLSLIEMMVAILISSILLLGVLELFSNTLTTDRTHTELARIQESGRVAMELVAREVRRAGYQGCAGASTKTVAGTVTYPDDAIEGASATSFTLNYARNTGAGAFPNKDCAGNALHPFTITFSNCGEHLCLNSTDSGGTQQLTTKTQISALRYGVQSGVPDSGDILWKPHADMATPDWPLIRKLQISLAIMDSQDQFVQSRTFTSVIELRNRQ